MTSPLDYKREDLSSIVFKANKKQTPYESIKKCDHLRYLKSYLDDLDTKFIIEERNYINYDYITDFSFYYAKSFIHYSNKCVRLHFFTYEKDDINSFKNEIEKHILIGSNNGNKIVKNSTSYSKFWSNNYLGFIVIRPIPASFLGYSILKHYNYKNNLTRFDENRKFWGVKDYDIHFKGNKITIEDSLAFMSQDGNVAACATIAIWCMLQRAVENYFINLKSPSEITNDAENVGSFGNRVFPNQGLDLISMCRAIIKSNLAPEVRVLDKSDNPYALDTSTIKLKKMIHAYSTLKIPLILAIIIPFKNKTEGHAVTICAHSVKKRSTNKPFDIDKISYTSQNINKIFAHDDQLGPFSKVTFTRNKLLTDWSKNEDVIENGLVRPLAVIATVFNKVRIPYEDIESLNLNINELLVSIFPFEIQPEWDIQLFYSDDFKTKIQKNKMLNNRKELDRKLRMTFLEEPMPKYIWVSTLLYRNTEFIHFIYDATALKNTNCLLFAYSTKLDFWNDLIGRLDSKVANTHEHSSLANLLNESISKFTYKVKKIYNKAINI